MKKIISLIAVAFLFAAVFSAPQFAFSPANNPLMDVDEREEGLVSLRLDPMQYRNLVLLVEKEGVRYQYAVSKFQKTTHYPLQMGNGAYLVRLMENIEGNKYKEIYRKNILVENLSETSLFTQSISEVNWNQRSKPVLKAKDLTNDRMTDMQKFKVIYEYLTKNFTYDYSKASTVTSGYVPDLDLVFESRSGICYDYAVTFASMTRSVGIPTKLVKGYSDKIEGEYHAWNEVFIDGKWKVVDTTYDSAYKRAGYSVDLFKSAELYEGLKVY